MYDLKKLLKQVKQPNRASNVFTTQEYATEVKIHLDTARAQIKELLSEGKIKPVRIKIVNITGVKQTIVAWEVVNA